jgi:two-component system chemotaxis sensor kinase CheA
VPAESVYSGFRKMVRDLASQEGKEIEFRVAGLDVQADRQVLQALKDSLMHILRNAVYHGIEPPEERRQRGKKPIGQVALLLQTRGNRLEIRLEDDGRGLDPGQIAEQAVARGLLNQEQAESAGLEELLPLLFRPGFSTAAGVTELAGRGMGLSVVQEAVARLQGEVCVSCASPNRPAGGTCVSLSVPLAVSAHRLLLVSCAGQTFAVPFHSIQELSRVRRQDVETAAGRPMLLLGGELLPFHPLADLLGLADARGENASQNGDVLTVMVLSVGQRRLAVAVDALVEESHSLLRDLDAPARADLWLGAILREDRSVVLVLSPAALLQIQPSAVSVREPVPIEGKERVPAVEVATILVVDDSLTTRTLEKSILEAHGYRVRLALDGAEALNQLRHEPADLVITDIQMPHLDGFGLLAAMKKEPRLARIPVIVVTSQERREDQERGLSLGADAYIVKRKFDHEDLLQTVRQLL